MSRGIKAPRCVLLDTSPCPFGYCRFVDGYPPWPALPRAVKSAFLCDDRVMIGEDT